MKMSLRAWVIFVLVAAVSLGAWYYINSPRFLPMDFPVGKTAALESAQEFLVSRGVDPRGYRQVIVFGEDEWADRYLQKTLGIRNQERFLRQHNYELFFWRVRFFKERKKEEFSVRVSPKTGKVFEFTHLIDDVEPREDLGKDVARALGESYLKNSQGLIPDDFDFHKEESKRYDRRVDYTFSWERKGVYIPWDKDKGGAKLLVGVTVSGSEVRDFYLNYLDIPENFERYINNQLVWGEQLFSFYFISFSILVFLAVVFVIGRRHSFSLRYCKKFFICLAFFLVAVNILSVVNNLQGIIINYPTATGLASYIWICVMKAAINAVLLSVAFIFPALAGETLTSEQFPGTRPGSISHYLRSTFWCRSFTKLILFGYVLFSILLGFQAIIFYFGRTYLGVWDEWTKFTQYSSSYIPFFGAFVIAVTASLNEEIMFRLFGISWPKRYFNNIVIAIILSAVIWGFGHCEYAIFPVWFRGIEVSLMGIFYGLIFVRYGIIPLIVAHYLFDAFWCASPYIIGKGPMHLFLGSLGILFIPLGFALIAFLLNRPEAEREMVSLLDPVQKYNLGVLRVFIAEKRCQGISREVVRAELVNHNWDGDLVDLVLKEIWI